jgi:hypothetical protein
MQSVPTLCNKEQLQLRESLETGVRKIGAWCEIPASLGTSEWSEVSWLVSEEISDSQCGCEAMKMEVEGSTTAITRQPVNTQQTDKN